VQPSHKNENYVLISKNKVEKVNKLTSLAERKMGNIKGETLPDLFKEQGMLLNF